MTLVTDGNLGVDVAGYSVEFDGSDARAGNQDEIEDMDSLNCDGCPALHLRDQYREWFERCERLRGEALVRLAEAKVYLLCESIPACRFVYDLDSDYSSNGLRHALRLEFVEGRSDDRLLEHLSKKGVLIVDCAFCPLHRLGSKSSMRHAATTCLNRHNLHWLEANLDAPIVTAFPSKRGYLKTQARHVDARVVERFSFGDLQGLREVVEELTSVEST